MDRESCGPEIQRKKVDRARKRGTQKEFLSYRTARETRKRSQKGVPQDRNIVTGREEKQTG